jgi:tRNA (cmo5U34)-methyltransferase
MNSQYDTLYTTEQKDLRFAFNDQVASVFPDMIARSIPGYSSVIHMIRQLASQFIQNNSYCYDLGCSLGEATLAMDQGNQASKVSIMAIDNSNAMIERCQVHLDGFKHSTHIHCLREDICLSNIENASMVVLNYTLQFIPLKKREALITSIYQGMKPGALLLLSEKILIDDTHLNELFISLHHQFKKDNGYSHLEISQKRNALENILIPDTLHTHSQRLKTSGFSKVHCWQQHLNFASFIAIK